MRTLDTDLLDIYADMHQKHSMDKEVADAACWNWVLHGALPLPLAHPDVLFGYVNRGEFQQHMRQQAEHTLAANAGAVWDALQEGQPLRTELDQIRAGYDQSTNDTATRNSVRDAVFALSLKAAGFTLSDAQTPYRVGMFEPDDVVMWDHWWLEVNGAVVETVTGHKLHAHSDCYLGPAFNHARNRVARKTRAPGLSLQQQARVHARYVTSLQDTQAGYLEVIHLL